MSLVLMIAALAYAAPAATTDVPEPDTVRMSVQEVKAFNATVDRKHPYHITCRKVVVPGSLAKRGHACRTARTWESIETNGNREARRIVEENGRAN